ncbi:MAG TPA: GntR family transcriptional regulator [Calditrichia bacterium]|nr:GntR family transcriptional regulator [Calditrichota bacterium]HQU72714.1 GntR family transcriptional regulator [Calditrichia bacterium]HQV31151.1 GntR family transcriptional regulator [Calditrichia bacterium]
MKYQRIQQQLLSEILTGAYQNDADFPSENALTRRFGVSRMTARRALDELSKAGYITRIPGKGTMLNKPVFGQGFFAVKPFHEYALERGARASTKLLTAKNCLLSPRGEARLGDSKAIFVHRLRSLDGEVVQEEKRYLRQDLCARILKEDLEKISIHDFLVHKLRLPLTRVWQTLEAVVLDEKQATLLQSTPGSPAFKMERVTYSREEPVTWVHYLMRGDRYRFENSFSPQFPFPEEKKT